MKKIIIGFIDKPMTASDHEKLDSIFGGYYGNLVSNDGHNNRIRAIKIIRAYTGANLKPANEFVNTIINTIEEMDVDKFNREEILQHIAKLDNHQVKMLLDHLIRNETYNTHQTSDPF